MLQNHSSTDFSRVEVIGGREKGLATGLFFAVIAAAFVSAVAPARFALAVLLCALLFALTVRFLEIGGLALVFFAPFTGLIIDFSRYAWSQEISYLKNIDLPLVDAWAIFLFAAWITRLVIQWLARTRGENGKRIANRDATTAKHESTASFSQKTAFPGWQFFLPFLFVSFLSTFNAPADLAFRSIKYFFRPIFFFYLMFVILPANLLVTKEYLRKALLMLVGTGIFGALMGFVSLFVTAPFFGLWRRATVLSINGFAPFAYNHNLLAEWLVVVLPISVYFAKRAQKDFERRFFWIASAFIGMIALLTFARTAWIALAVEAVVYFALVEKGRLRKVARAFAVPLLVTLLPLAVYMGLLSTSPLARSSTATRLDLTRIAFTYFVRHPWIGNGAGAFVALVEDTRAFRLEYGDALDAHGVIQKLLAEEGILGIASFSLFAIWVLFVVYRAFHGRPEGSASRALLLLLFVSLVGALTYQLFNTSYYISKLWVPIGIALAAVRIFGSEKLESKN